MSAAVQAPLVLERFEDGLRIETFSAAHRTAFARLNRAWLERYFKVEPIDERVLGDPEGQLLAGGGEVLFALLNDRVVGTVALKREAPDAFELTKMAVDEAMQGRGYGKRLLAAACALAQRRGASRVRLYSQRSLKAALAIYAWRGFKEAPIADARYSRCDIYMELAL